MVSRNALAAVSMRSQLPQLFPRIQVKHSPMPLFMCQRRMFFTLADYPCDCPSGSGTFVLLVHAATLLYKAGKGVKAGC